MIQQPSLPFHQHIWARYNLELLIQDQWIAQYQQGRISLVKSGTKTTLTAKALFLEEQQQSPDQNTKILFYSAIITPEHTFLQPRKLYHPLQNEVYRILGHYESYINRETNITEILTELEKYKIK